MLSLLEPQRPTLSQSIFRADEPVDFDACIDLARGNWLGVAGSYRAIAERAARDIASRHDLGHHEFFALAFLWRHYLELMLKALLHACVPGEGRAREDLFRQHKLLPLWAPIAEALSARPYGAESQANDALVRHVISDFDVLDPGSFDFRYPADRSRENATLASAPPTVNVLRLHRWMVWVADRLEATFDALSCGQGEANIAESDEAREERVALVDTQLEALRAAHEGRNRGEE